VSAIRVCRKRGCITNLSASNPGTHCWAHTLDLTQTDHPAPHLKRRVQVPRNVMSSRFLGGLPGSYTMTPAEQAHWLDSVTRDVDQAEGSSR
jgi:hypothetical protein